MSDSKNFKIFLSSPGNVPEERDIIEKIIAKVRKDFGFREDFNLILYRWDDPDVVLPMEAPDTPQKSVDRYMVKPSDCDLVVVLFWSRMGTPLNMDGEDYRSGTEYEYKDAVKAKKEHGKPRVWLYRCTRPFDDEGNPKKQEQYRRVNDFFEEFTDEDGRLIGGVNFYESQDEFASTFGGQLRTYLRFVQREIFEEKI